MTESRESRPEPPAPLVPSQAEPVDAGPVDRVVAAPEPRSTRSRRGPTEPEPRPTQSAPGGAELTFGPLLDSDESGGFESRWRAIKSSFVDDPQQAVHAADTLYGEVMGALTAALDRRRGELDRYARGDGDADTERLRVALRGYRSLVDHMLSG